jgi:NAD(P)-dependent dehydrogenase (short-subunit alcohol dehydrogenase family)
MSKIAITGHSAGIGKALSKIYESHGHTIVGLSRRNGYNIKSVLKLASVIEPCDIFINNAQIGFAQTELLFAVYQAWKGQKGKRIINISSLMTSMPVSPIPGMQMLEYYVQKKTLEEAIVQLRQLKDWPKLCLVKPGGVATQPGHTSPQPYADVDVWASRLVEVLNSGPDLEVEEITLNVNFS